MSKTCDFAKFVDVTHNFEPIFILTFEAFGQYCFSRCSTLRTCKKKKKFVKRRIEQILKLIA